MRMISTLLALLLSLLAFDAIAAQGGSLGLSSMVSTRDPNLRVAAGATVSWRESAVKVYQNENLDSKAVGRIFRGAIEAAVLERGYQFAAPGDPADFELGFLLALASSLDDDQILRQFGFSPGLQGGAGSNLPEKGTLVVILIDPRSGRSMWRGAIQAFANLGASEAERQQRASLAATKLMRLMPDVP